MSKFDKVLAEFANEFSSDKYLPPTVTQRTDPAYFLLHDGHTSTPITEIYRESCYICRDPEFAQMGLPLCYKCSKCGGHVAADDSVCDDCGHDQLEDIEDDLR